MQLNNNCDYHKLWCFSMLRPRKSNSVEIVWSSNFTINERIYACILEGTRADGGARESRNGQKNDNNNNKNKNSGRRKVKGKRLPLTFPRLAPVSPFFSPRSRHAVGFSRRGFRVRHDYPEKFC